MLREKTNAIWKQKVDWVARRGGMALVIVHPDYLAFDDRPTSTEYAVSHYRDLLLYINERYRDTAWLATPEEVAQYVHRFVHRPEDLIARADADCAGTGAT